MSVCLCIHFEYLLIQVGRRKAEKGIKSSYRRHHRNFLDGHGGFFVEEFERLANDEEQKKDNNINKNKPEASSTEHQKKLVEETYEDEDNDSPYQEQYQSNRHQIENVADAAKS